MNESMKYNDLPSRFTWQNITATALGITLTVGGVAACIFGQLEFSPLILFGLLANLHGFQSIYERSQTLNKLAQYKTASGQLCDLLKTLDLFLKDEVSSKSELYSQIDSLTSFLKNVPVELISEKNVIIENLESFKNNYYRVEQSNQYADLVAANKNLSTALEAMDAYADQLTVQYNLQAAQLGSVQRVGFYSPEHNPTVQLIPS